MKLQHHKRTVKSSSFLELTPKKRPDHDCERVFEEGGDILSHQMAVPSALVGITSLFGMGRGEPYCYNHLNFRSVFTLPNNFDTSKICKIKI